MNTVPKFIKSQYWHEYETDDHRFIIKKIPQNNPCWIAYRKSNEDRIAIPYEFCTLSSAKAFVIDVFYLKKDLCAGNS